jgi:hypothetical protein
MRNKKEEFEISGNTSNLKIQFLVMMTKTRCRMLIHVVQVTRYQCYLYCDFCFQFRIAEKKRHMKTDVHKQVLFVW